MKSIRPALALCAATAAIFGGLAYGDALPAKSQERLPMASLSPLVSSFPRAAPAAPEPVAAPTAEAAPGQYRIAISRVTPPAPLISQTAQAVVPAHFAPPPQDPMADDHGPEGEAPPPREARRGPPPPPPPPGPLDIAGLLAAQEIALAIRTEQLDAWRTYAGAVVDMVDLDPVTPPKTSEPFSLPEALATRAVAEGKKAQALLDARTALMARLSPDQLEKARKLTSQWPHGPQGPLGPQGPQGPQPGPGARP
ncbi:hypothetical protein [Aquabacter cavernae]|uniref:hypothetical protein n=1 Tax=Aquabacter cavernae TaxID=2496029 RepID=UPI000F8D7352|nr:hypothetical protein [Aquabacter cavernae]